MKAKCRETLIIYLKVSDFQGITTSNYRSSRACLLCKISCFVRNDLKLIPSHVCFVFSCLTVNVHDDYYSQLQTTDVSPLASQLQGQSNCQNYSYAPSYPHQYVPSDTTGVPSNYIVVPYGSYQAGSGSGGRVNTPSNKLGHDFGTFPMPSSSSPADHRALRFETSSIK